jgi:putative transposase
MKASKFSDAQKAFILRQGADGVPVADICRKAGISQATYFNWKKKYDGMQPPEMRRLKQLEDENSKLKKIVADLSLDREMLQDVIRRKLQGLLASASWRRRFAMIGACRSGGRAASSNSTGPPIITNHVAASRPAWKLGSKRFARRASATGTGASMSSCVAKAGRST